MLLRFKPRKELPIIDCPVRLAIFSERSARHLSFLLDFPCERGARTPEDLRAVSEVNEILQSVHDGRGVPTRIVVPYDEQERPISIAVVSMKGDGKLTRGPYIEALARHTASIARFFVTARQRRAGSPYGLCSTCWHCITTLIPSR